MNGGPNGVLKYVLDKLDALGERLEHLTDRVDSLYHDHEVAKAQAQARRDAMRRTLKWFATAALAALPVLLAAWLGVQAG